jgi:hypothetical protein
METVSDEQYTVAGEEEAHNHGRGSDDCLNSSTKNRFCDDRKGLVELVSCPSLDVSFSVDCDHSLLPALRVERRKTHNHIRNEERNEQEVTILAQG